MKILALILNGLMLITAVWQTIEYGFPNAGDRDFYFFLLWYATPIVNSAAVLFRLSGVEDQIPKTWPAIYFYRKAIEEQRHIENLQTKK